MCFRVPQSSKKCEDDYANDNDADTELISPNPPFSEEYYPEEDDHNEYGEVTKYEIKSEMNRERSQHESEAENEMEHDDEEYHGYEDDFADEDNEDGQILPDRDYHEDNTGNDIEIDPAQLCQPSHLHEHPDYVEDDEEDNMSNEEEYNQSYPGNREHAVKDYDNEDDNDVTITVGIRQTNQKNKPLGNYGYSCKFCGLFFTTKRGADTHEQNHKTEASTWPAATVKRSSEHGGKRFPCRICKNKKEVFLSYKDLKAHLKTHGSDRIHVCKFCFVTFKNTADLTKHLVIHETENPHKCECGKTFVSANTLKIHRKIHTGLKPFVCDYPNCSRAFVTKSTLESHIRTHTGEKPFQCGYCSSSFTTSSAKYRHERHVHKVDEQAIL